VLKKLPAQPGIFKDSPSLTSEGFWSDGKNVRFFRGKPEKIGGWTKFSTSSISGKGRAVISFSDSSGRKYLSIGTNKKLYIADTSNTISNITPLDGAATTFTVNIATVDATPNVTITHNSHGRSVGDTVIFANQSSAVGGITLSGTYLVTVVPTANTYTVVHTSNATSTVTTASRTIDYQFELSIGPEYGGYQFGWGVGGWGLSTWGTARAASSVTLNPRTWSISKFGNFLVANPYAGKLYVWDGNVANRATYISTGPDRNDYSFVTPERFVVCLGTHDYGTDTYSPTLVRWSDQEDYANWTPSATTLSGEFPLQSGSVIMGGGVSRVQNLIWTDTSLYAMRYLGDIELVYGFNILGTNCGLIGSKAWAEVDGVTFWMSNNNKFFMYDGSAPRELTCTVSRYVFDDLEKAGNPIINCAVNSRFNEVVWYYPSISSTNAEIDRFVAYNYVENTWYIGDVVRTAWVDGSIFNYPIGIGGYDAHGDTGYIYSHEDGHNNDGTAIDCYIESAQFDVDDGENVVNISRIVPDVSFESGSTLNMEIKTRRWANSPDEQVKTLTFDESSDKVDTRAQGRVATIKLSSNAVDNWWRVGDIRVDISGVGRR
jgi:hypothetical protein